MSIGTLLFRGWKEKVLVIEVGGELGVRGVLEFR